MTKEELETMRLQFKIEALTVCLSTLLRALSQASPVFAESFLHSAKKTQNEYLKIVLRQHEASTSDMVAAEFQDAFDDLIKFLESELLRQDTGQPWRGGVKQ